MPRIILLVLAGLALSGPAVDARADAADDAMEFFAEERRAPFEVSAHRDKGYRASNSVSASRIDTPIIELPFAIQAFTESFIAEQKPANIFDVARYAPGVTYRSNDFNEGNANLAIRGFAVSSTPGSTQILRDGLPGPSILDFTNVSRVEVVKGPASFLYGQLAPGGIVNVITKSPQSKFAAGAGLTYGSYGSYRLDADATGPATRTLLYRVAASYDHDINYWDLYDARSMNVAPSLRWQPGERVSFSLKYENFIKREDAQVMQKPGYGTQAGLVPTPSDPNLSGVDVPGLSDKWNSMSDADFRDSDTSSWEAALNVKADDHWDLRGAYGHQDYQVDAVFSGNFGMANNATVLQGRRFRRQVYTNRDDTFEGEAVGKYRFDLASLRLLVGGQVIDRRFESWAGQAPNDPALGSDPTASPLPLWDLSNPATWNRSVKIPLSALTESQASQSTASQDKAAYAGATVGFLDDRLLVLAGLRQTNTASQLTNLQNNVNDAKLTASRITPQYGLLYKLIPGLVPFFSYSESFVPGTKTLNVNNLPTRPAAPTEGRGYDLGVKSDLLDGRVSGTLTLFEVVNKNIINDLASLDPNTGTVVISNVQSGEQRSRGVELDATLLPAENWQVYLSYSYMDARITEFSGDDAAILARDPSALDAAGRENYKNVRRFHNAPLQMSAPHLANVWTRYDFTRGRLRGLYVAGGTNFVYEQTLLPDSPASARQTYALLSAKIGCSWRWRERRMSADLMGKNLADEHYRPSQSSRSRPREFSASLSMKY